MRFQIGQTVRFRDEYLVYASNRGIAHTIVITAIYDQVRHDRSLILGVPAPDVEGRATNGVFAYRLESVAGPW